MALKLPSKTVPTSGSECVDLIRSFADYIQSSNATTTEDKSGQPAEQGTVRG